MAARDIRLDIYEWAEDEITRQCLGEEYAWAATWGPAQLQGPQGPVTVPLWQLVLTCRNPLLGQGDLFHVASLGAPRPAEADVRREVAEGIRQLRELARSKIAEGNGRAMAGAPPGRP